MESIRANKQLRSKSQPSARCAGSKKRQATFRSCEYAASRILTHQFLPLYEQALNVPDKRRVEKGFFASLSRLAESYGFQPMDVAEKPYPYNVLLAQWDAAQHIRNTNRYTELSIVQDEKNKVIFSTKESLDTNTILYYIPVLPLYRFLKIRNKKAPAELLLSVFAYLYHVAGIPYYRNTATYLYYQYDMIEQWIEDEKEQGEEDYRCNKTASQQAAFYGDVMERKIYNQFHLDHFSERLSSFCPKNTFDSECHRIAAEALAIWNRYPDRNIYSHINEKDDTAEEDDYEEDTIRINEYVSFIAENEGSLYDSIAEMVNCEFQEKGYMQQPEITKYYRQTVPLDDNLDFERRLFDLISDLCSLLNELP